MEKKIGKNVSSGAEKVENAEKESLRNSANGGETKSKTKKTTAKKQTVNKTAAKAEKAKPAKKTGKRAEKKERAQAQKRVEAAKKRAAKKEAKIQKRAALKEKRLEHKKMVAQKRLERKQKMMEKRAAIKNKKIEKRAERIARRELLKHETRAEKQKRLEREKKERIALKRQKAERREKAHEQKMQAREAAHARKAENAKHKREQRTRRKENSRGFGGWLAAVISLGVACLALATVVTAGAFRMNEVALEGENGARSTLYEMLSVSEDMDNNLTKLRVSEGREEQRRLLTNVLVDSALLENAIERVPVDAATSTDISSFVNNTNSYARTLLKKLAAGEKLTQTQKNTIAYLWEINKDLTRELNTLATTMSAKDLRAFMNGKAGAMSEQFAQMGQTSKREPQSEVDAPFSGATNVVRNQLANREEITQNRAEELVRGYFENYNVQKVSYTGETTAQDAGMYNFVLTDANGVEIYAQITKNGGKLAFMDIYEENTNKQFDLNACNDIAQEFLTKIGIDNAEAVWYSDGGSVADIVYTSCDNGVYAYPDTIRVRVCECKGIVVGVDARGYWFNYAQRDLDATLSAQEARSALTMDCDEGRLALIAVDGEEVLAYEFLCKNGDNEYLVYVDAETGDEVLMYTVREGMRGRYLI